MFTPSGEVIRLRAAGHTVSTYAAEYMSRRCRVSSRGRQVVDTRRVNLGTARVQTHALFDDPDRFVRDRNDALGALFEDAVEVAGLARNIAVPLLKRLEMRDHHLG